MHIQKTSFCSNLEKTKKDFALQTLKDYIGLLIDRCFKTGKEVSKTVSNYIQKATEIKVIKIFAKLHEYDESLPARFVYQFLDVFGLSLSLEDIQNLNDKCIGAKNQTILQALQKLHNDSQDIRSALLIFSLLHTSFDSSERFKSLDDELKIEILT